MKLSDFQYNYIGHHLKEISVDSNLGCCHGNAFVNERLGKILCFSSKMAFFSLKTFSYRTFLVQIRNQRLKIDPCAKFQPDLTKDKGVRISTWNETKTAWWRNPFLIVMTSAKFSWILRDFVPEYHHVKFGGNWIANKRETAYILFILLYFILFIFYMCPQPIFDQNSPSWIGLKSDRRYENCTKRAKNVLSMWVKDWLWENPHLITEGA